MAKKVDGRPLHQQIAAKIRATIMDGDLRPGAKLRSTRQLEADFDTTSRTMQDALNVLKDEGLIIGRPGQGVFVLAEKNHAVDLSVYVEPSAGGYSYEILDVIEVRPPGKVADLLGLADGEVAVLRYRIARDGGEPRELERSYYPVELARGTALARRTNLQGGAPRVLADAGFPLRSSAGHISVRPPTTDELLVLELPESVHVLCQTQAAYSDGERPVEVSVRTRPGHQYELRYRQSIS